MTGYFPSIFDQFQFLHHSAFLFPLLVLIGCGKVPTAEPNLPVEPVVQDFEQGTLTGFHYLVVDPNINTQIVTSPVRNGGFALKNTLRPNDYVFNGYRSELAIYDCAKYKTEVYYGFSFNIDTSYKDTRYNLICQWQDLPNYQQGEDFNSSPILHGSPPPLYFVYVNGTVGLVMNTNPMSSNQTFYVSDAPTIQKGIWHDVVFHVFWSDSSDGYVEAWLDGTPITQGKYYKANLYNRTGNYFKFGQYRGKDKPEFTNTVYFDDIKIGKSYADVMP